MLVLEQRSLPLARKLLAEGRYAGFQMEEAVALERSSFAGGRAASGVAAAIEILSDDEVLLTVHGPRASGADVFRLQREGEVESFPLRIIEHLRARLTDLGWAVSDEPVAATPGVVSAVPPAARSPVNDRTARAPAPPASIVPIRIWLTAGLGALRASGGLGTTSQGLLGARLSLGAWGVGGFAFLPLQTNDLQQPEGQAEVGVGIYALQASYEQRWATNWWASLSAGPGLAVLSLDADATAPLVGKTDRLLCGVGSLELSVTRQLGEWLRLRAGALVGISAPRPVMSFAGRDVAAWGRAFGALTLRVEAALPPTLGGD